MYNRVWDYEKTKWWTTVFIIRGDKGCAAISRVQIYDILNFMATS